MANPLKVLTQLSASKEAQFAEVVEMQKTVTVSGAEAHLRVTGGGEISGSGAFKVAGASQLGSTLDVKGASALSGALGVVGAADLQSSLTLAGAADLNGTLDVQDAANFQSDAVVSGSFKSVGEISGSAALKIGGNAEIVGHLDVYDSSTIHNDLVIGNGGNFFVSDGNVDINTGELYVAGNISTDASASIAGDLDVDGAADVAGNLDVHGNAVVYGNLEVKGTMTTIESTTVTVADANIQLATVASPTDATADGAGITVLGATNKTFQWNNDGHGFTSSEDMNLAAGKVYKIDGQEILAKDGSVAKLSFNGGTANLSVASAGVSIAGDLSLADDLHVSGTLGVDGVATFASDITASANVDVAGNIHAHGGKIELDRVGDFAMIELDGFAAMYANSVNELSIADGALSFNQTSGVATFASDITASAGVKVIGELRSEGVFKTYDNSDFNAQANFWQGVYMDSGLAVQNGITSQGDISAQASASVSGDLSVYGITELRSALSLSGSAFINITTPVVDGQYNVNDAIRALDAKVGEQGADINDNYNALRYLAASFFDANGMAAFTSSFAAADIEKVSVDVLVQAGGSGPWTNDLLSVQVKAAGSYVGFEISAPAMAASDKVRIIAVKESGSLA